MIDPKSPEYANWYQANLATVRQCAKWREEIKTQKALRVLVDGTQRVSLSRKGKPYATRAELAKHFQDRGPAMRKFARSASRDELAERIIADRLAAIDTEIARLERLIAENQPSLLFRAWEGDR